MSIKQNSLALLNDQEDDLDDLVSQIVGTENKEIKIQRIKEEAKNKSRLSDHYFDSVFPKQIAKKSFPHWTPCEVARRAFELLCVSENSRVLDVGSGCGKFCILGGLHSRAHFTGVELREGLVKVAKQVKRDFELNNVSFVNSNMSQLDWASFNCFYLFNPFYENLMKDSFFWIDKDIQVDPQLFGAYTRIVEDKLNKIDVGSRVVTYHGFGGTFPESFTNIISESIASGFTGRSGKIELWVKTR